MSDTSLSPFNRIMVLRGEAWACLILRLFIGFRLLGAGIAKYKGFNEVEKWHYDTEFYKAKMEAITGNLDTHTFIPPKMLELYSVGLGPALIGLGALIIFGLLTRLSLMVAGFLMLSLAVGLMLLPDDVEVIYRGVEIALIAGALCLLRFNCYSIDGFCKWVFGSDKKTASSDA